MRWPACGIVIEMTDVLVHVALKVDRTNHVVLSCVIRRTGPGGRQAPCRASSYFYGKRKERRGIRSHE
jgi:hypothetical protein